MDTMKKYRDIQTKYQEKYKERMEKQYLIGIYIFFIYFYNLILERIFFFK